MGLDCTGYSKVKFIREATGPEDESGYDEGLVKPYINPHYPAHAIGIQNGWYDYDDSHDFRAGSYGSYNNWREELCELALGVTPGVVWNNPDAYVDHDLYWLINFSDCEGVINAENSGRILRGLRELHDYGDLNSWGVLDNWFTALELAADDGFITFH